MKLHIRDNRQTGPAPSAVVTPAIIHDKHPLPDLLHDSEQRVYGDSAYASQKDLIARAASNAKDFSSQRTRYSWIVDDAVRAKNRNKSRIRSRVEHALGAIKRL
jgi:IS5 family transposase